MRETNFALDILHMFEARNDILGPEIMALGEYSWILLLQMFVHQANGTQISHQQMMQCGDNPRIARRIINQLVKRDMLKQGIPVLGSKEVSYRLTRQARSKVQMILATNLVTLS
ncbi:hypothetical protein [Parasphingorhabdus cellanae]|uniref:MarR family transcriptional regulator n=1 Tax=Parasphingorhabdus cellanae TaxID=2806553 RepID=A0ABX7T7Q1_9SPHN|nr:hypothetical protein [Parasphingorhabdus cellanae]QTD56928.1 hypothetical protein J4G78_04985 [Parasphingorhabdus cellanae]